MKKLMLLAMAAMLATANVTPSFAQDKPKCNKECCKKCPGKCKEECKKCEDRKNCSKKQD